MSESSLTAPLHELLRTTRLSSLLKDREVVSLDADCTVDEALRTLSEHRLLAAPLRLDEATAKSESLTGSPTPTVFLDIRDILSSFMHGVWSEMAACRAEGVGGGRVWVEAAKGTRHAPCGKLRCRAPCFVGSYLFPCLVAAFPLFTSFTGKACPGRPRLVTPHATSPTSASPRRVI